MGADYVCLSEQPLELRYPAKTARTKPRRSKPRALNR